MMVFTAEAMTSLEIAELTGKRHDHVIRDLKVMEEQGVIALPSFEEREKYGNGNERTIYRLPKRETLILTSGYSAKQRAAIIDRWLALEVAAPQLSPAEFLVMQAQRLLAQEQELARVAQQTAANTKRLEDLNGDTGYVTALGYCRRHKIPAPLRYANKLGRAAAAMSRDLDIKIGDVPDERWGSVHSYAVEVLDEAREEMEDNRENQ